MGCFFAPPEGAGAKYLVLHEEDLAGGTGGVRPPKVDGVSLFDFASGLRVPRGASVASGLLDSIVHGLHPFVQGITKEMADKNDSLAVLKDLSYAVSKRPFSVSILAQLQHPVQDWGALHADSSLV